ncbi:MAG: IS91 family transposase [Candidatus Thiodiazotropha sp.]
MDSPASVQAALNRFLGERQLDSQRRKVCGHLQACRTEAMGGQLLRCERCGEQQRWYHGCRDRHCPQCQDRATRRWADGQHTAVLPVTYYHLVFTLPHGLNGWVQLHPDVIYRRLFDCAWLTLKRFGRDPKRLGGQLGMSAVMHTWGQTLIQHVHLHCLVPGGALTEDGQWRPVKGNYLFPVRALSHHFRGTMVSALRQSAEEGELSRVTRPGEIERLLDELMEKKWVVYAKHCLNRTESVVDYLARYTHRIAITNGRILKVDERGVKLRYKDYADNNRIKVMNLKGEEFVRRYLLHVLPKGFTRIRHYGFLAGCCRTRRLAQIREALALAEKATDETNTNADTKACDYRCPQCKTGYLHLINELPPMQ